VVEGAAASCWWGRVHGRSSSVVSSNPGICRLICVKDCCCAGTSKYHCQSRSGWNSHREANRCTVEERICQRVWTATSFNGFSQMEALQMHQSGDVEDAVRIDTSFQAAGDRTTLITRHLSCFLWRTRQDKLTINSFKATFCTVTTPSNPHMER